MFMRSGLFLKSFTVNFLLGPVLHLRLYCHSNSAMAYQINPIKIGAEVFGISLQTDPSPEVIEQIKKDVHKYEILIFRDQGNISGNRHVEISKWFGELDSTFYRHPKSPHLDVFRVSNDEVEGCTGVGRTGWHIDGSFQPAPFSYSLYHMVSVPTKGDTAFVPLNKLIMQLPKEKLEHWEQLWMASDRRHQIIHPLIYSHPNTGRKTLCFHLGMTEQFVWNYGTAQEKWTDQRETLMILKEIHNEIIKDNGALQYSHKWTQGDFIISDNLAVGHEATPESQSPRSEVGLRVLHRTTVKGHRPPAKQYSTTNAQEKQEL